MGPPHNPDRVYLLAWGGASTIARALKSIHDRYAQTADWPAVQAKASHKAILVPSGDQDDTYAAYIHPEWPDVRSLAVGQGGVGLAYGAYVFASAENARYFSVDWIRENVSSRGPFSAHYRVWGDGKQMVPGDRVDYFGLTGHTAAALRAMGYAVWLPPRRKGEFLGEGDTFTFLNLLDNGLGAYRDDTPGGWGGTGGRESDVGDRRVRFGGRRGVVRGLHTAAGASRRWRAADASNVAASHAPRVAIRGSVLPSARAKQRASRPRCRIRTGTQSPCAGGGGRTWTPTSAI